MKHLALPVRIGVAAAAALIARPAAAIAQSGSLNAVRVSAEHRLLANPLVGVGAGFRLPLRDGPLALRLDVERVSGRAERTGIPCAGLIQPGTCAPEPLHDDARLLVATGGAALRVMSGRRIAIAVTGALSYAAVRVETRGQTSGDVLLAGRRLWGGVAGFEGAWTPVAQLPLALEAGAEIGSLRAFTNPVLMDGYTPFNGRFDVSRLRVGVAWRSPPAR